MLNIGDRIFMAKYGAGIVENIEYKKFLDVNDEYINIYLLVDDMNLLIPSDKIEHYKIRKISNKQTIEEALRIIGTEPENIERNWNKRYRKDKNKIYSNDLLKMCEVIRDLYFLRKQDMLPPGEEKILERVESMVASEIALAYNISFEQANSKIIQFA